MTELIDRSRINENRARSYGLRIGDLVKYRAFGTEFEGTVVELSPMDNNSAWILTGEHEEPVVVVAEWCSIIVKVEDRLANDPSPLELPCPEIPDPRACLT
jgi:hypothetical protein